MITKFGIKSKIMGYSSLAIKGVSWMGGLKVSTRILTFVKIAILARILTPGQFGLFGIAMLVLALLEVITETGINIFLIQEDADLEEYKDTAWIVSIARGILIFLVLLLSAPFVSSFFNSPDALPTLYLTSLIPLVRGFINPAVVKFQKELNFNREFYLRVGLFSFDTFVAVLLGVITRSATSLVWAIVAASLLEVLYSLFFIKPKPKFAYEISKAKKVISRGKWVTLAGVFNYLFENLDDMIVGRLIGTASLGIYQMAYKISSLPITEVADVVIKVTFPVYVKISREGKRLKEAFLRTLAAISILVFSLGIILFLFSEELVLIILGPNWLETVSIIKALSFFGIVRAVTASTYPLFLALKRQDYVMGVTLAGIFGLGVSIIPLVMRYGELGAAYSALTGSLVAFPVAAYFAVCTLRKLK